MIDHNRIFNWWREHGRVLPWREKLKRDEFDSAFSESANELGFPAPVLSVREQAFFSYFASDLPRDPYRVVVSELMLQQTQVDRVKEKYEAWMKRWPTSEDLAKASLGEVIVEWKGLGYNRRARFLWLLAKEIVEVRGGEWPTSEAQLMKLPGIGRYTARALLSFAMGVQVGVIDTNVKRIFERWFEGKVGVRESVVVKGEEAAESVGARTDFFALADELLPPNLADPWNQALMDFGALVCTAKNPHCEVCPVSDICAANARAQREGFAHFAAKLSVIVPQKKARRSKDYANGSAIAFEQTDRFLRGKVVDLLREKGFYKSELVDILSTKYTQFEKGRIEQNISKLMKEGLVSEVDGVLRVG